MAKQGSVTLLVVMILAVLAITGFTVLRNTTFLVDGVLAREQYVKQYYATQALMHYGIGLGQRYFDEFKRQKKETKINVGAWPLVDSSSTGKLTFISKKNAVMIQAILKKDSDIYCTIDCQLIAEKGVFEICNWQIR